MNVFYKMISKVLMWIVLFFAVIAAICVVGLEVFERSSIRFSKKVSK